MPKKPTMDLQSRFAGAVQTHQTATSEMQDELITLRVQVEKLQQEKNEQTEAKVEEYRQYLEANFGSLMVHIDDIGSNPKQARQTITQPMVLKRAQSMEREGQRNAVILIRIQGTDQPYMLEDGELRWRAAQYLVSQGKQDWQRLKAVISPLPKNEVELLRLSLIHGLHTETLNPLDRAEAIVALALAEIEIYPDKKRLDRFEGDQDLAQQEQLVYLIRKLHNWLKQNPSVRSTIQALETLPQAEQDQHIAKIAQYYKLDIPEKELLLFFLGLQIKISSFAANDLRMLKLLPDLKQAIQEKGLGCYHAMQLQKLSAQQLGVSKAEAQKIRSALIQDILEMNKSTTETDKLIKENLIKYAGADDRRFRSQALAKAKKELEQILPQNLDEDELVLLEQLLQGKMEQVKQARINRQQS